MPPPEQIHANKGKRDLAHRIMDEMEEEIDEVLKEMGQE